MRIHAEPTLIQDAAIVAMVVTTSVSPLPPSPAPETVVVPELVGMPEAEAFKRLAEARLKLGDRTTEPAPNRVGLVLAQGLVAGSVVPIGTAVDLVIGTAQKTKVPKVVGLKLRSARRKIKRNGLTVGTVKKQTSDLVGVVLEQDPEAEKAVPTGTDINVVVRR